MSVQTRSIPTNAELESRVHRRGQSISWDEVAGRMPDLFDAPSTQYYRNCEIAMLRRELGSLRGKRLLKLDLWNEAINTRILHWARSEGAEVHGMDLSLMVTARARSKPGAAGLQLLQADIRDLPYADESFDIVYTMGTIEHIAEYSDSLSEIARVLKKGGRAVIGVPNKWDLFLRPLLVATLELFGKYPYSPEKSFSERELRRDVEKAGLTVTRRTGILAIPGILRMADVFFFKRRNPLGRLTGLMIRPFEWMETRNGGAGRLGYLLTVIAERPVSSSAGPIPGRKMSTSSTIAERTQ